MKRTYIKDIEPEKEIKIQGFIERIREPKSMIFLVVRDISSHIQITVDRESNPEVALEIAGKLQGSFVTVYGTAHKSEYVKMGGIELIPTKIVVESSAEALPINSETKIEDRLNFRWIDLRDEQKTLVFKISTAVEMAMREYLIDHNFIEIHTPKISGQSSEGGAEVFKLDYFGQPAYLTQSPQLYKQMAMSAGFEKVFEFGDCFRAEQSFTARHATEFLSFDIEMSYIESHHDVMDMEEELLCHTLSVIAKKFGKQIKEVFNVDVKVPTGKFPRISYADAVDILAKEYGYVGDKNDFDTESERLICNHAIKNHDSEFVFITDYPTRQRAFYSMRNPHNPEVCKSFDLLWKDQEITSGAQREHRPDELAKNIENKGIQPEKMQGYIDFFRYGCPPHGGYAIGMARLVAKLLGLPSIKESTFIFRGPNRLVP